MSYLEKTEVEISGNLPFAPKELVSFPAFIVYIAWPIKYNPNIQFYSPPKNFTFNPMFQKWSEMS